MKKMAAAFRLLLLAGCGGPQLPYNCLTFSTTMMVNEPMAMEKTVTSMTCTAIEKRSDDLD